MSLRRVELVAVAVAALATVSCAGRDGRKSTARDRPNVILVTVDDLGWTDLACYGSRYYETPNVDQLAREGMRFTDAYAAAAVCSPSRAALMTGRAPARTGITDWIHHLDPEAAEAVRFRRNPTAYVGGGDGPLLCPPNPYWMELEEITVAEVLRSAGYVTGHIGKWHLGPEPWFPEMQGFDVNLGGTEIGQPPSYFDPYHLDERRPSIATLPPRREGEYLTDREADEAVRFIQANAHRPFFLNLSHYAVHTPLEAKAERVARHAARPTTNHENPVYAAMIESVDQALGRILQALRETGLSERTLIAFTSDNGGLVGHSTDNAPLRSGKGYPYEGGLRVPLIVRWPGVVAPDTTTDEAVSGIDFLPTIAAILGEPLPADRVVDGESLLPVLQGTGALNREALYWHFPHYREPDVGPYSVVRKGEWKLVKRYEGPAVELFNLAEDLGEARDLARERPDKARELDRQLDVWLENTGARLPKTSGS